MRRLSHYPDAETRASMDAGPGRNMGRDLLFANLANPRIVGRSVVAITGLKPLLLLGGVYAQLRATGAMRGPAFMRREVYWPRSATPCCSPMAGLEQTRDRRRADGSPRIRAWEVRCGHARHTRGIRRAGRS